MRKTAYALFMFLVVVLLPLPLLAQEGFTNHDLNVTLAPNERHLTVIDTITVPKNFSQEFTFLLHSGLHPSSTSPIVQIERLGEKDGAVPLESFKVILPAGLRTFTVAYAGSIYESPESSGKGQARGFGETSGIVFENGVFLSRSSSWYPDLGPGLVTFTMEVQMPPGWDAVSQGERTRHDQGGNMDFVHWQSPEPQEDIYLVANRFYEYSKPAGRVLAMAFLRTPDQALAEKYLDATARYLDLYSRLIGPYPYQKFALVENFWETGYGMPSFTLLGPTVIRLPFIINTSYPHEILHNWWGNSVYPDYEEGNWSEGLTAYLADHLMKEQQGEGKEYRMTTLQKYADYVLGGKDFPLSQFRSRHSPSTEAVGYGKGLMFFHMLRQELGDAAFKQGLREFYKDYQFQYATFSNLRTSLEAESGQDLKQEFDQWVFRTGAPRLKIGSTKVSSEGKKFILTLQLEQTQPGDAYRLRVLVAVTLDGQERAYQTVIEMKGMRSALTITVDARPRRVDVDPEFDVFRRLDRLETPPSISQALGARRMLIIIPDTIDTDLLSDYRAFAKALAGSGPDEAVIKLDSDVLDLPRDRAVAVIGWENRFANSVAGLLSRYGVAVSRDTIRIGKESARRKNHAIVLSARTAQDSDFSLLFIASDLPEALPGLARKLPHYHKYSYLVFKGKGPENTLKGTWPVGNSPLTVFLPNAKGKRDKIGMARLAPREPLAALAPVFSTEGMMSAIRFLSSDELEGRGFGSPGLDQAADFIAQKFKEAGLVPGGDREGSWFQTWEDNGGDPLQKAIMKNVIGIIPGRKPALKEQSVVIGAHYDHLGRGWPETRDKVKGNIHPGADDNASGVAVMLELARLFAKQTKPDRTIVFIAFTGEEAGRRGSTYYVANEKRWPMSGCIGMVNLDMVGRLGKRKLLVLGTDSAKEWVNIFRGAGFVTGVGIETAAGELDSGDQKSFQDAGVPAVQLFSGPHLDYHRSSDSADKIDSAGLSKVAAVAKEAVAYLASRELPLTATTKPAISTVPTSTTGRTVTLGVIPDFGYNGKGLRLSGVMKDSPAEAAGLKEGDVIVQMKGSPVENLRDLSDILKTSQPGDRIPITFRRGEKESVVEAVLQER